MALFYGSYVGYGSSATTASAVFHGTGEQYGVGMGNGPGPYTDHIQKFSFTSASAATDVANLTGSGRGFAGGCSSETYGFCVGGGYPLSNIIDKHQFDTTDDSTDVGDLTGSRADPCCTSSVDYGFSAGGYPYTAAIDTFQFSATANATGHGNLARTTATAKPMFSATHGYASGGSGPAATQRDKYAFASNTTAIDDGDELSGHDSYGDGTTSDTHGFAVGGTPSGGGATNIIDRTAFDSGGTATDWGDLSEAGDVGCCSSAVDYGYKGGGGSATDRERIEKFAYASDAGSVDTGVGMLSINSASQSFGYMGACQY